MAAPVIQKIQDFLLPRPDACTALDAKINALAAQLTQVAAQLAQLQVAVAAGGSGDNGATDARFDELRHGIDDLQMTILNNTTTVPRG